MQGFSVLMGITTGLPIVQVYSSVYSGMSTKSLCRGAGLDRWANTAWPVLYLLLAAWLQGKSCSVRVLRQLRDRG